MKNVVKQVALLGLALLLMCALGRLALRNTYVDRISVNRRHGAGGEMRLMSVAGQQAVVDPGALQPSGSDVQVTLKATQPGEAWYEVRGAGGERAGEASDQRRQGGDKDRRGKLPGRDLACLLHSSASVQACRRAHIIAACQRGVHRDADRERPQPVRTC